MSEQDNISMVKKMYQAFAAGDVQSILNNLDSNAEWTDFGPATIPYSGSWNGHPRILEFFKAMAETTTKGEVVAENFIAAGDTVAVTGRFRATVRDTGAKIDSPIAHFFTIRDGKVVKWVGYSDTAAIAEAHRGKAAAGR
jgi:ketosteroid isomerase-like protein